MLVWGCRSVTGRFLLADEGCNEAVSTTKKLSNYSIPKFPTPKAHNFLKLHLTKLDEQW